MEAVAAEAGTTKPTLYKYFPTKEQLFGAMMHIRRDDLLVTVEPGDPQHMVEQLHRFAWHYARTVMHPDMLALARLIIGEAQRFPRIGRSYQESGPDPLLEGLMTLLTHLRDARQLRFGDAELAAQDLWGLILSAPRNRALHDPEWAPQEQELARYIENGLSVFLRAYAADADAALIRLGKISAGGSDPTLFPRS